MARVQMLHHITGGRGDGTVWPHAGGILECGDDEAAQLVRGNNAIWPPGEPQTVTEPPAVAEPAVESPDLVDGSQDDEEPPDVSRPRVRDAKEVWEQHAIQVHGVDVNAARSMTKADLIATYGNGSSDPAPEG